jgi:hypothetical protein
MICVYKPARGAVAAALPARINHNALTRSASGVSICTFVPVKQVKSGPGRWHDGRSASGVSICTFVLLYQ